MKDYAALDILEALGEYFLNSCLVKAIFTGQDVCSQSTIILGSSFQVNQQITKKLFLQPLRSDLKRNQFTLDTFAWPESEFVGS